MSSLIILKALVMAVGFLPPAGGTEIVELRTGVTLVGEVRLIGREELVVEARFPDVRTYRIKTKKVKAESLYRLFERRAAQDVAGERLRPAEFAESEGLRGIAVAGYRAVLELDPGSKQEIESRLQAIQSGIAGDLLTDARQLLESGSPARAVLYLHTIVETYPDSEAAKGARALMPKAHRAAGTAAAVDIHTVPADQVLDVLRDIEQYRAKAAKLYKPGMSHDSSSSRTVRAVDMAIALYEAAWRSAKSLPVALGDGDLQARIDRVRESTRKALVSLYLAGGTLQIQRRAISRAGE